MGADTCRHPTYIVLYANTLFRGLPYCPVLTTFSMPKWRENLLTRPCLMVAFLTFSLLKHLELQHLNHCCKKRPQDCPFSQGTLPPLCTHVIHAPRPSPSVLTYRNQSKTGRWQRPGNKAINIPFFDLAFYQCGYYRCRDCP